MIPRHLVTQLDDARRSVFSSMAALGRAGAARRPNLSTLLRLSTMVLITLGDLQIAIRAVLLHRRGR